MKPRLLFICAVIAALILIPSAAQAQAQPVTAGIKGGLSISNIDFSAEGLTATFNKRYGVIAGAFVGRDFRENFGIQIEGLFVQKGTKSNDLVFDEGDDPVELDFLINYLEIPVLAQVTLKASDNASVRLFGGPAFAFKLSQTEKIDGEKAPSEDESALKAYDMGLTVGAGCQVRKVGVEFRYTYGFVNINNEDDADVLKVKNRSFGVLVTIQVK